LQTDISIVRDGERSGKVFLDNQIVVPLLDAPGRSFDLSTVIFLHKSSRPSRFGQITVRIQERMRIYSNFPHDNLA